MTIIFYLIHNSFIIYIVFPILKWNGNLRDYLKYTLEIRKKNLSNFKVKKFRPNEFFERYVFLKAIR